MTTARDDRIRSGGRGAWRRSVPLAASILCVIVLAAVLGGDRYGSVVRPHATRAAPARHPPATAAPLPTPAEAAVLLDTGLRAIPPQDAVTINAARPLDRRYVTPAFTFALPLLPEAAAGNASALECMTKAIYYEAASESDRGERAVAQVVLNRMRSPIFPHTVCGVVFQGSERTTGCQFSFTCDGSLRRRPGIDGWRRARRIAAAALSGRVEPSVGLATHYHANYVVPYWADSLDKTATIGAHIFYVMRGGLGRRAGFREAYAVAEEGVSPPAVSDTGDVVGGGTQPSIATGTPDAPKDRTEVREDALGVPIQPRTLGQPASTGLRADEDAGKLTADEGKASLRSER